MSGRLVVSATALTLFLAAALQAQESMETTPTPAASGKESSSEEAEEQWPSPRPIADSVDKVVADMLANDPDCKAARSKNVPCFPSSVQVEGDNLQKALDRFRDTAAGEGPAIPSATDEERLRRMQQTHSLVLGSFDPVCVGKSLWRRAKGQKDTFWVYRITDQFGEMITLRDEPLEAGERLSGLPRSYELVGKYEGECAALAAYLGALRAQRRKEEEEEAARKAAP